jgi:hypothetical protein
VELALGAKAVKAGDPSAHLLRLGRLVQSEHDAAVAQIFVAARRRGPGDGLDDPEVVEQPVDKRVKVGPARKPVGI